MEIDQKPDTYVKTVLTFGNKPARAMAQIVFRKIAAEGETSSLSAAKTLKKKKQQHGQHSGLSANCVRGVAADDGN